VGAWERGENKQAGHNSLAHCGVGFSRNKLWKQALCLSVRLADRMQIFEMEICQ
jgi:hypothetical protein